MLRVTLMFSLFKDNMMQKQPLLWPYFIKKTYETLKHEALTIKTLIKDERSLPKDNYYLEPASDINEIFLLSGCEEYRFQVEPSIRYIKTKN